MSDITQTFGSFETILVAIIFLKLSFNLQRLQLYKKGGITREKLLKLDVTFSHQIGIIFAFFVFLQAIWVIIKNGQYISSLLACIFILIDQPFYFYKLKSNGSIGSIFSCAGYFLGLYSCCFLISMAYTFLFSIFPYVAKWVLLFFALNLLPSIIYCCKKNAKPLWLSSRILNDCSYFVYLVYIFGYPSSFNGLQSDQIFLTIFVLIDMIMILVFFWQSIRGGRILLRFMPRGQQEYTDVVQYDPSNQKYYEKITLVSIVHEVLSETDKMDKNIVALNDIIKKARTNDESIQDCVICLENLFLFNISETDFKLVFNKNEIAYTTCKHLFHPECLDKWLETRKSCPYCRCQLQQGALSLLADI